VSAQQTDQGQGEPRGTEARVAEEHRRAREDYANGQSAREGLDRAHKLRGEMWGS
jgi:hypothetical protein